MKKGLVAFFVGVALTSGSGCFLHPPYGDRFAGTSTVIPPVSRLTHVNNLPPAEH